MNKSFVTSRRPEEIFKAYLREKALRNSRQREIILDAFLSADKHITAEELFHVIKKKSPEIGIATVHRNLSLFSECGLADEIKIGKQKTRYEQKYGHEHHDRHYLSEMREVY